MGGAGALPVIGQSVNHPAPHIEWILGSCAVIRSQPQLGTIPRYAASDLAVSGKCEEFKFLIQVSAHQPNAMKYIRQGKPQASRRSVTGDLPSLSQAPNTRAGDRLPILHYAATPVMNLPAGQALQMSPASRPHPVVIQLHNAHESRRRRRHHLPVANPADPRLDFNL
ncbi:hypothetical protein CPAR01_03835 [Colletotrichum paranaense]|uniref:Uncharacterized protein n=2 Tax=Colletotrichum acutatum species complex TaxID=2707335 RepID=A0AAI9V230_9PEZI|nr:uncharacterized protein CPAR01_03835 [Colletotrichum paranaense]KAK1469171.1 hypothetical protein CMEL01_00938 [Colletotrichum melonis]KAK1543202.1 hypothetical protein CPAR01_03835 [Colletotrichum paranaense]